MARFDCSSSRAKPVSGAGINAKFVNKINSLAGDSPDAWAAEAPGEGTPVERVAAARGVGPVEAALWLCEKLGIDAKSTGYIPPAKPVSLFPGVEGETGAAPVDLYVDGDGRITDRTTGETVHDPAVFKRDLERATFPEHLLQPPGLIGELVDVLAAAKSTPNRPAIFAGVISVIATLGARCWNCPEEAGDLIHLYTLLIGTSSIGKGHAYWAVEQILTNTFVDRSRVQNAMHFSPVRSYKSETAVMTWLQKQPSMLAKLDEFGSKFKNITAANASPHIAGMGILFQELYAAGKSVFQQDGYKDTNTEEKHTPIHAPALTILAAATKEQVYDNLKEDQVRNGFVNRIMTIPARIKIDVDALGETKPAPLDIARLSQICERLATIFAAGATDRIIQISYMDSEKFPPKMHTVEFADEQARKTYYDFLKENRRHPEESLEFNFFGRASEYAIKLAVIYALSVNQTAPIITVEAMKWAVEVARFCFKYSFREATRNMARTEVHSNYNRVVKLLADGGGAMPKTTFYRSLSSLSNSQINDLVDKLKSGGLLEIVEGVKREGRGAKATYYILSPEAVE